MGKSSPLIRVQPFASAMIVRDGKIIWVGEQSNVAIIDGDYVALRGQRVLPGLNRCPLCTLLWLANCSTQIRLHSSH